MRKFFAKVPKNNRNTKVLQAGRKIFTKRNRNKQMNEEQQNG